MSRFTRAFLDELLGRTSILDVVGRKVVWDKRKSQPARGDMWACCPFHQEKSPSFHALDSKGVYKCFGCGEGGTAIDFVMKTDNLSFPEAVERLAADAGMPLPARDPQFEEKVDAEGRLLKALADARACFEQALLSGEGAKARAYLHKRGIPEADWGRFGLGWAPQSRTWLKDRLTQGGHALADLVEAGLLRAPDDGGPPFDAFRGRVLFAIEDARGRTVSFGARTLDPDGQPKYLNGPESPVFHKGRTLYRFAQARGAARDKPIVVAEGYVDVIALERAGFPAVAPLGTALTEDQLALVWKAHKRPILCFDGDAAGRKAASRSLDRALPLISAEKSLAFAFLPEGQDPDDLIRARGGAAMQSALEAALPVGEFLFEREREFEPLTTAEAKAGFRKRLRALVAQVRDPDLKRELGEETRARLDSLFAPRRRDEGPAAGRREWTPGFRRGRDGAAPALPPTSELRLKVKAGAQRPTRALIDIVTAPLRAPALLDDGFEPFAALQIADSGLDTLRHSLLDLHSSGVSIDFDAVRRHLLDREANEGVRALEEARRAPVNPFVRSADDVGTVRPSRKWLTAMDRLEARRALASDAAEAVAAAGAGDEAAFEKLSRLVAERRSLGADGTDGGEG
jgi:DNA primase